MTAGTKKTGGSGGYCSPRSFNSGMRGRLLMVRSESIAREQLVQMAERTGSHIATMRLVRYVNVCIMYVRCTTTDVHYIGT